MLFFQSIAQSQQTPQGVGERSGLNIFIRKFTEHGGAGQGSVQPVSAMNSKVARAAMAMMRGV